MWRRVVPPCTSFSHSHASKPYNKGVSPKVHGELVGTVGAAQRGGAEAAVGGGMLLRLFLARAEGHNQGVACKLDDIALTRGMRGSVGSEAAAGERE